MEEEIKSKTIIVIKDGTVDSIQSTDASMVFFIRDYDVKDQYKNSRGYIESIDVWPDTQWEEE